MTERGAFWLRFWRGLNGALDFVWLAGLAVAIGVAGYCLYDSAYIYTHTLDNAGLTAYKPTPGGEEPVENSPITEDMVGWLTIDGTSIDYPVMQGADNSVYLNLDPTGEFSLSGSIFLDSLSSPDFSDEYSLIYGHHMSYGKLFGALDAFLDEDYARSHCHGTLLIGRDGERQVELTVFAVLQSDASVKTLFRVDRAQGARQYIASHALFTLESPPQQGRIVALSTCTDSESSERTLVMCYIKE